MAELRQALQDVDALDEQVSALRRIWMPLEAQALSADERDTGIAAVDLEQMQQTLANVTAAISADSALPRAMTAFRARMTMLDPVTQAPRFGPKTLAKVAAMLARYDAIQDELATSAMLDKIRATMQAHIAQEQQNASQAERARELAEHARREQEIEMHRQREELEAERHRREQEAEAERIAELARGAQQKREEREQLRREQQEQAQRAEEALREWNAQARVGPEALMEAVQQLEAGIADRARVLQSVDKLDAILANICAAPENEAYRHIPKDNAHFHEDLGQYEGAYECLRTLGFKQLQPEDGRYVFVMEEPDLSEDLDAWSTWFDRLKAMKDALEAWRAAAKTTRRS